MASSIPDTRPPSKGERLTVRFDEGELARVRRRALAMKVAPSVLVRGAVLDVVESAAMPTAIAAAVEQPVEGVADKGAIRELITELNRVGVNLNQLVRKVNAEETATTSDPKAVTLLTELLDVMQRVVATVGGGRRAA